MNGVIIIDKPLGKTSHDMVYFLRRITHIKKIGHTGTLDPNASGVLPMCIGKATKAAQMLTDTDKRYSVQMTLGAVTDTQDADGEILTTFDVNVTEEQLKETVASFEGEIMQIPPMYSAVKVNGKKLYQLAREGIEIEREGRKINIYKIDILDINLENKTLDMDVYCSKGTYIRTLCHDIGQKLGCGAYVSKLRRTQSGLFKAEDSYTVGQIEKMADEGTLESAIIPVDELFGEYEKIAVTNDVAQKIKNGMTLRLAGIEEGKKYRVYDKNSNFLSISYGEKDNLLKLDTAFWM